MLQTGQADEAARQLQDAVNSNFPPTDIVVVELVCDHHFVDELVAKTCKHSPFRTMEMMEHGFREWFAVA